MKRTPPFDLHLAQNLSQEKKCRFEYEPYAGPIQLFQVGPTMFGPPGNFTNSAIANLQLRMGGPPEALDVINNIVPPFKDNYKVT